MGETKFRQEMSTSELDERSKEEVEALARLFDDVDGARALIMKHIHISGPKDAPIVFLDTGKKMAKLAVVLEEQRGARLKRDQHGVKSELFILETRLTEGEPGPELFGGHSRPMDLDDIERSIK